MQELSFRLVEDGAGSGLFVGYLSSSDHKFAPFNTRHSGVVWTLLSTMAPRTGATVVWSGAPGSADRLRGASRMTSPDGHDMASVFWKQFGNSEEFTKEFPDIWNNSRAVRVYPITADEGLSRIVSAHYFDRRDKKRLGMDYGTRFQHTNRESPNLFRTLRTIARTVRQFTNSVADSEFLVELMNPFRSIADTELVKELSLFLFKGAHDEAVFLQLMTSHPEADRLIEEALKRNGVACDITRETRTSWT